MMSQYKHLLTIPDTVERITANEFKKRLAQIRREKARIQQKLLEREIEIDVLTRLHGNGDFLFDAAEQRKLYGGL